MLLLVGLIVFVCLNLAFLLGFDCLLWVLLLVCFVAVGHVLGFGLLFASYLCLAWVFLLF